MKPPPDDGERLAEQARAHLARLALFRSQLRRVRLALFRQQLALEVRSATPLLASVGAAEGIDFRDRMWNLRPSMAWPERGALVPSIPRAARGLPSFSQSPSELRRRHRHAGVVVHLAGDHPGLLGVRARNGILELTAHIGDARLETRDGLAFLRLPGELPATVASAAPGLGISEIVSHPWFHGRPWPIERIAGGTLPVVVIRTGLAAWRMPWGAAPTDADIGIDPDGSTGP